MCYDFPQFSIDVNDKAILNTRINFKNNFYKYLLLYGFFFMLCMFLYNRYQKHIHLTKVFDKYFEFLNNRSS